MLVSRSGYNWVMGSLLVAVALLGVFWVSWRREPRRLRLGVYLVLAAWFALGALLQLTRDLWPTDGVWALLPLLPVPLTVLALAGFLVANGLMMVRKEGRSLGNLLSLVVGVALVVAPVVTIVLLRTHDGPFIAVAVFAFFVCVQLGASFAAFLAYTLAYRRVRPGDADAAAVVVLGSGLVRGQVPRLLAGRLDRAVTEWRRLRALGFSTPLVPSGGQGPDEPRAEGDAMGDYLTDRGIPASDVVVEDAARTTEENLELSVALLRDRGREGRLTVVTSGYHAPRAALISRRLGMDAVVLGAPTARYFVPSAYLREFVAVLTYHPWLHLLLVAPSVAFAFFLARAY